MVQRGGRKKKHGDQGESKRTGSRTLVLEHEKQLRANLPFRVLADRRPVGFRRFDAFFRVGEGLRERWAKGWRNGFKMVGVIIFVKIVRKFLTSFD